MIPTMPVEPEPVSGVFIAGVVLATIVIVLLGVGAVRFCLGKTVAQGGRVKRGRRAGVTPAWWNPPQYRDAPTRARELTGTLLDEPRFEPGGDREPDAYLGPGIVVPLPLGFQC